MTRAARCSAALLALLVVVGCAQQQPESEPEQRDEPEVEQSADEVEIEIDYEFDPVSTLAQSTGWPANASSAPYWVSVPIETECHWVEATSLVGPAIAETIALDPLPQLEGLACGITPTPASDRDDLLDEVAWRVDEGLAELVAAYAGTVFPDEALDCEPVDVPRGSPGLSVEHLGSWYVVRPAALACPETVEQITEGIAALRLTEVLRHTTTFDDYLARGY